MILFSRNGINPVEQVWQQLRDNRLANRCYESYDAIVDACCHAWNWFINVPHRVRQLCGKSWAKSMKQHLGNGIKSISINCCVSLFCNCPRKILL